MVVDADGGEHEFTVSARAFSGAEEEYAPEQETTVVDVPLGYADGVPRHGSNAAPVQVGGRRFGISGRVCMDQFVVDVGDLPVAPGDPVLLFGTGAGGGPTAQDWAEAAGTISYEIVTRFGPRVPRVYTGAAGQEVSEDARGR